MGHLVEVIAPAGPVAPERLEAGLAWLKERGISLREAPNLRAVHGHLAGTDPQRAAALEAALLRPGIDLAWAARGGFGCARLLARLDWKALQARGDGLATVVGYSDLTALQTALWTRLGRVSWHGPMVAVELAGELDALSGAWLDWALELREAPATGATRGGPRLTVEHPEPGRPARTLALDPARVLVPGRAEGPLLGGNLSVLTSLAGTPWWPDFEGALLLLEDHGEYPFRLDRHLAQLANAGALERIAGVLLGHFPDCGEPDPAKSTFTLAQLWEHYFGPLGVPVVSGLPVGHAPPRITLPIGGRALLEA
jgi:muramoyltetrapeptide carboxypeptidase